MSSTASADLRLWVAIQNDLPKWIYNAIRTMGLPASIRGAPSTPTGSAAAPTAGMTRTALLLDAELRQAITSEVYLALREGLDRNAVPADEDSARGWLCVTTTRIARRLATRQAPYTAATDLCQDGAWGGASGRDPEQINAARELLQRLEHHAGARDLLDREILLGIAEGESPGEVAERLGENPNTVRSRLARLRTVLSKLLSVNDGEILDEAA